MSETCKPADPIIHRATALKRTPNRFKAVFELLPSIIQIFSAFWPPEFPQAALYSMALCHMPVTV